MFSSNRTPTIASRSTTLTCGCPSPSTDGFSFLTSPSSDGSGSITFDEFKSVFSANIGPDAIPFNFDADWVKLYIGTKNVLGCEFSWHLLLLSLLVGSLLTTRS